MRKNETHVAETGWIICNEHAFAVFGAHKAVLPEIAHGVRDRYRGSIESLAQLFGWRKLRTRGKPAGSYVAYDCIDDFGLPPRRLYYYVVVH